jgi:hypothetical protein
MAATHIAQGAASAWFALKYCHESVEPRITFDFAPVGEEQNLLRGEPVYDLDGSLSGIDGDWLS